jgi:hypothetical protein
MTFRAYLALIPATSAGSALQQASSDGPPIESPQCIPSSHQGGRRERREQLENIAALPSAKAPCGCRPRQQDNLQDRSAEKSGSFEDISGPLRQRGQYRSLDKARCGTRARKSPSFLLSNPLAPQQRSRPTGDVETTRQSTRRFPPTSRAGSIARSSCASRINSGCSSAGARETPADSRFAITLSAATRAYFLLFAGIACQGA